MVFNMKGWGDDFSWKDFLDQSDFDSMIRNNNRKVKIVLNHLDLNWYSKKLVEDYRKAFKNLLETSLQVPCLENMRSLEDFCNKNDFDITFDEREKDIYKMQWMSWRHIIKNKKKDCTIAHTLDRKDHIVIIQSNTLMTIEELLAIGRRFVDRVAEAWRWWPIPVFLDDRNKEAGLTL